VKKIEDIDLDKLATLTGFRAAIKNGETTIQDIFIKNEDIEIADLKELFELKRESLTEDEIINIERIIKTNEVTSFKKVYVLLKGK